MSFVATVGVPGAVVLEIAGEAAYDFATVSRVNSDGSETVVRGIDRAVLNAGAWISEDNEAPVGQDVTYRALLETAAGASVTRQTVLNTLAPPLWGTAFLDDVHDPSSRLAVYMESVSEIARDANVTTYPVLGSPFPVAVQDTMQGRTGSFTMAMRDLDTRDLIWGLLENSTALLLRTTREFGLDTLHFVMTSATEERVTRLGYLPHRRITVEFIETAPPPGTAISASSNTWRLVSTSFTSWQNVLDNRASWALLLTEPAA